MEEELELKIELEVALVELLGVVLALLDGADVEVGVEVDVGIGVGSWLVLEIAAVLEEELELLPPTSKISSFAVLPCGMVTTQKEASPAPMAGIRAWMSLTAEIALGSISQGSPTQPASSSQVILAPKVGMMFFQLLSSV